MVCYCAYVILILVTIVVNCPWTLCCVPITSCKRCARLSQLCKPFQSRSHWEFPICTSGEVETGFLSQFAPLGKRWRRLTENLVLSLFNFNFVQRALLLEDYPCAGTRLFFRSVLLVSYDLQLSHFVGKG